MDDLALRVDSLNPKDFLHIACRGVLKRVAPVIGVAPVLRLGGLRLEGLYHYRKGHFIRFTDAHINQRHLRLRCHCRLFGALDLLKLIDCGGFTVLIATDALGEEFLNIWIAHG